MIKVFKRFKPRTLAFVVGALCILIGAIGVVPTLYYRETQTGTVAADPSRVSPTPKPATSQQTAAPQPPLIEGDPVAIAIPSLHMNLTVINGYYNSKTGAWTLTNNMAQFATPSVMPNNQAGNTLIYGHYRPEVFAYLHLIKVGAEAIVTTDNGYQFTYSYTGSFPVNPKDTSIFDASGVPRLTVQTCSGAFMQNRQMYQFTYLGYTHTN